MDSNILRNIILDQSSTAMLVKEAEALGKSLAKPRDTRMNPLSTSQIRAIYGEVLRIKADWLESRNEEKKSKAMRAFLLLRPKMAYRARKEGGAVKDLVDVL